MSDIDERLTEYCLHGGLYNPELMQHEKVRDLLIDCRSEIARLRLTGAEREAIAGVLTGRDHLVIHDVWKDEWKQNCDTLRGLLERLGGDK